MKVWSLAGTVFLAGFLTAVKHPALEATKTGAKTVPSAQHLISLPHQLITKLTENFRCPTTLNSLVTTDTISLKDCSQFKFEEWSLNCLKEDENKGVSVFNQTAGIIVRTATLGLKCRHPVTCQWPSCYKDYNSPFTGKNNQPEDVEILKLFQEDVMEGVTHVINTTHNAPCKKFTGTSEIWKEVQQKHQMLTGSHFILNNMAVILGLHLSEGRCLQTTTMTSQQLTQTTEDPENSELYNEYLEELFGKYSDAESLTVTNEGIARLLQDVGLYVDDNSSSSVSAVRGSSHRHRKRSLETSQLNAAFAHLRSKRSVGPSNLTKCLTSESLLDIFDLDSSGYLNKSEFLQLCSYVVYQISNGNKCGSSVVVVDDYNRAEVYGYGTLAVFVISACSALGFIIIPMMPESVYEIMMTAFIALAFGTLTGDALLHMLPESFIDEDNDAELTQAFYKSLAITFSIYLLFFFEGITNLLVRGVHDEHEHGEQHGHSHTHDHNFVQKHTHKNTNIKFNEKNSDFELVAAPSTDILIEGQVDKQEVDECVVSDDDGEVQNLQTLILSDDQTPVCIGLTSLALVIIIGDAIHNVTDGISIGASFASDLKTGFSTSLAVLFHELPHEFGDFVILLTTGLSLKKALLWNFISSLSAFLGLYIGIAVGENQEADKWIFAVTSGMFLYVAIADMLPEMKNIKSKRPWLAFLAQNIGALFGIGFMIFMHYLEDLIHF